MRIKDWSIVIAGESGVSVRYETRDLEICFHLVDNNIVITIYKNDEDTPITLTFPLEGSM